MTDIFADWSWPQWIFLTLLLLGLMLTASRHGQPRLIETGQKKGQPEEYSFPMTITKYLAWILILSAGGFF